MKSNSSWSTAWLISYVREIIWCSFIKVSCSGSLMECLCVGREIESQNYPFCLSVSKSSSATGRKRKKNNQPWKDVLKVFFVSKLYVIALLTFVSSLHSACIFYMKPTFYVFILNYFLLFISPSAPGGIEVISNLFGRAHFSLTREYRGYAFRKGTRLNRARPTQIPSYTVESTRLKSMMNIHSAKIRQESRLEK